MILTAQVAIDGDEEKTVVWNPIWNLMRQMFSDGKIHRKTDNEFGNPREAQNPKAGIVGVNAGVGGI